jgi:23S rRNA (cytidine1920-2'-O)/16S rRNA (cytidine1409-2'-O)-methyltransferase
VLVLVKPQFEVGRRDVGPGGIVSEPGKHLATLRSVAQTATAIGLGVEGGCAAPIRGAEGNQEFFLHLRPGGASTATDLGRILGGMVDGE